MKYQLSVLNHRVKFILAELGKSAEVIDQDGEYTRIAITIEGSYDLLCLFHAGIREGMRRDG